MTRNATGSLNGASPRAALRLLPLFAGACLVPAAPLLAQKNVTEDKVTVGDVMLTPLADLNLSRDPIPPALIRAHADPYEHAELTQCMHVMQEIGNLDAVLGEDFDTAARIDSANVSPESVAQNVVASFIPFRGVIRQLSGANRHAEEFRQAIVAGLSRRAFLKGMGLSMDCAYPARPAPPGLMVRPEGTTEDAVVPE